MKTVTVSEKGQVVIPADIRRLLGITPGCQLNFILDGNALRVELKRSVRPTHPEEGYGLLACRRPGSRRLSDFDIAQAMRDAADDRS
jgi:antitoxin PrlF